MLLPHVGPIAGLARDCFDPIVMDGTRADDFIASAIGEARRLRCRHDVPPQPYSIRGNSMLMTATVVRWCAPQLREPLITAAGGPAELIALRMRTIEVLVACFCLVKRLQGRDPGDNTFGESLRCCQGLF